jgi:uncharacterized membrane protein YgaE (UPF0421/DUF939 family)
VRAVGRFHFGLWRDVNWRTLVRGLQLAVRAAVAAGVAVAVAQFFKFEYPIYAFLAAVIATDLTPSQSRQLGLRRIVATMVGATCGALLSPILPPGPWGIGLSVLIAMLTSELLQARDGAKVAGFICGIIVLDHSPEPWLSAYGRFIETALGVAAAWAISYVPKLIRMDETKEQGK